MGLTVAMITGDAQSVADSVAIPLAAGVLASLGFVLPMAAGAVAMSASTIIVAANAQLLRRLRLRPE